MRYRKGFMWLLMVFLLCAGCSRENEEKPVVDVKKGQEDRAAEDETLDEETLGEGDMSGDEVTDSGDVPGQSGEQRERLAGNPDSEDEERHRTQEKHRAQLGMAILWRLTRGTRYGETVSMSRSDQGRRRRSPK